MYQFSDSDSKDSDEGIRFKTDSTRYKTEHKRKQRSRSRSRSRSKDRDRHRSKSKKVKKSKKKHRRSSSSGSDSKNSKRKERSSSKSQTAVKEKNSTKPSRTGSQKLLAIPKGVNSTSWSTSQTDNEESRADIFGPSLPPNIAHFQAMKFDHEKTDNDDKSPPLNDTEKPSENDDKDISKKEDNTSNNNPIIGPVLPPHLCKDVVDTNPDKIDDTPAEAMETVEETPRILGPELPPHLREQLTQPAPESDEEEVYGPMPEGSGCSTSAQRALEERALQLKMGQLDSKPEEAVVREEWMLELPEVKAVGLGLGPRQFRSKPGPDLSDRSSWTDTPNKKKEKKSSEVDLKAEAAMAEMKRRDKEQEMMSKKHKRDKQTLLEMHQDKLKSKKEASGSTERRPFSRETDLQVNRFDEAQKNAVLKKAQLLDDRFSAGQSKFL